MTSRIEKLEAMLELDPDDTMARYMLALELEKSGDHDRCMKLLTDLMNEDPPYIPAFVMGGQYLAAKGESAQAATVFETGIQAAKLQGNEHAAGEMMQFRAELPA